MYLWFFFFQAEDGIRDSSVTGVQTCALPISAGIIPIQTPLIIAVWVEFLLGRRPEELCPIGILRTCIVGNLVAPSGIILQRIAVPKCPDVVDVADHALLHHFLGLLIERIAAVLRAHLNYLS